MTSNKQKEINSISGDFQQNIIEKWYKNSKTNYVLHIGPTNSGKSYHAIEKLKTAKTGVYLCPLRLLAWEVSERLNADGFNCNLITGEEQVLKDASALTACTIEMMDYSSFYQVVVIDESFMLGDKERGKHWLKAILESNAEEIHVIANDESEILLTKILTATNKTCSIQRYERLTPLVCSDQPLQKIEDRTVFVAFGRRKVLISKSQLESKKRKATVLYGNLPPELKKKQIQRFSEGKTNICVSTDVIGMGINLPCDIVCFTEVEKFDGERVRKLNSVEIKQIAGRAGRFGLSEKGIVTATNKQDLDYIRKQLKRFVPIQTAYFGIDHDIFSMFPADYSISKRLQYFATMSIIPATLDSFIRKETMDKYFKLDNHFSYLENSNIDLEHRWHFITSPVHDSSVDYWLGVLKHFILEMKIKPPVISSVNIYSSTEAEHCEKILHDIDLYIYFSNHRIFKHYISEVEMILKYKYELIEKLDQFLMNRKLTNMKKCAACGKKLPIEFPHLKCEECYFASYVNFDF